MVCSFIDIFHYSTNMLSCVLCGSVALCYKVFLSFTVGIFSLQLLALYWEWILYYAKWLLCSRLMPFNRIYKRKERSIGGGWLLEDYYSWRISYNWIWLKIKLHRLVHWKMVLIITIIFWGHVFECTVILLRIYNDYLLLVDYAIITLW